MNRPLKLTEVGLRANLKFARKRNPSTLKKDIFVLLKKRSTRRSFLVVRAPKVRGAAR